MPDLLRLLWERSDLREPVFGADEVAAWPAGALERLTGLGLLRAASRANSLPCDSCGTDHVEEVVFLTGPPGACALSSSARRQVA